MRAAILDAAARHHASNVRVFGSIASGADTASSDVDLIVHFSADASLYDQIDLITELEELLGFDVDVISDGARGIESISPVVAV
jgi:predicted nucleotidyltransferase